MVSKGTIDAVLASDAPELDKLYTIVTLLLPAGKVVEQLLLMAKDAERYRWLRVQPNDTSAPRIDVVHWEVEDESANAGTGLRFEELDAAIDAARGAK